MCCMYNNVYMYIPLFYKGQTNTAIGLAFNWALIYKKTQKHINNTIETTVNV